MFDYIIALALAVGVAFIPVLRRAVLSVIGLTGIAALAILGIGLPVWALYELKPWLVSSEQVVAEASAETRANVAEDTESAQEREDAERLRGEEQERQAEAQRVLEEQQRRIAEITESAREIVAKDGEYAKLARSSQRFPGLDRVSIDLIAIRIPTWRDSDLAEREKVLIRSWLHSLGLLPAETAQIHTASAWGSLYDLWRVENPTAVTTPILTLESKPLPPPDQSAVEEEDLPTMPQARSEPLPSSEPRRLAPSTPPARTQTAPDPRPVGRDDTPPTAPPPRRRPPEREVGPFGY
jgi:hypothetical protein